MKMELMSLALIFDFDGDVGVFQERCKMIAAIVCFLDSCFDLSVKSSIFCNYATEVLELSHLLELTAVDVEFAVCSAHLHCLSLADAYLHVTFFTGSVQAICTLLQLLFICKALVIGKQHFFKSSGSGFTSFVILFLYTMNSSGDRTHPCLTPRVSWNQSVSPVEVRTELMPLA